MKKHILLPIDKYQYLLRHASLRDEPLQLSLDQVIDVIPKRWQHKARALLQMIQDHVQWDSKGQLVINGEVIDGSHISDVVKHAIVPSFSKKEPPLGSGEFAAVLKETNAPKSLLINKPTTQEWYTL